MEYEWEEVDSEEDKFKKLINDWRPLNKSEIIHIDVMILFILENNNEIQKIMDSK